MQDEETNDTQDDKATGELTPLVESRPFKVKLVRKHGSPSERVTLFSYPDGERVDHFDCSSMDGVEKVFTDLSRAKSFMDAALETGGFLVADDSQVKPKA